MKSVKQEWYLNKFHTILFNGYRFEDPAGWQSTSVLLSSFYILVQKLLKSFEGLRELAKQCFGWLFQSFLWMNFQSPQPLTSTWTSLLKLVTDLWPQFLWVSTNFKWGVFIYLILFSLWIDMSMADHPKGPFTSRTITIMTTILVFTNGHQWILFCLSNKHTSRLCRLPF